MYAVINKVEWYKHYVQMSIIPIIYYEITYYILMYNGFLFIWYAILISSHH